jgi:hypothetical protein
MLSMSAGGSVGFGIFISPALSFVLTARWNTMLLVMLALQRELEAGLPDRSSIEINSALRAMSVLAHSRTPSEVAQSCSATPPPCAEAATISASAGLGDGAVASATPPPDAPTSLWQVSSSSALAAVSSTSAALSRARDVGHNRSRKIRLVTLLTNVTFLSARGLNQVTASTTSGWSLAKLRT